MENAADLPAGEIGDPTRVGKGGAADMDSGIVCARVRWGSRGGVAAITLEGGSNSSLMTVVGLELLVEP